MVQWAFRQTECDPITLWHHCNECEWELNRFDEPISVCLVSLSVQSAWATADKLCSLIFKQANVVMISTFRNSSCRTCRVEHQTAHCQCTDGYLFVKGKQLYIWRYDANILTFLCWGGGQRWVNSLERWRWMESCAGSTEPLHSSGLSPLNLLLLAGSDRLCRFLSQKRGVGGSKTTGINVFFFLKWHTVRDNEFSVWLFDKIQ